MLKGKDLVQLYGLLTVMIINSPDKLKDTERVAKEIGHMLADAYDYSEEIQK